ncbi:MAG: HAD family phosphatase [Leptospiraceae bacterium]|nr:HAD family phosphatase [Leptospiraceae bacterium]MCP5497944.1 HAD family phosphatase [Leptospiraceae bacterium]
MEAILFDMDGLMIDTERLYFEAERELADRFQRELQEKTLWKMMGRNPLTAMQIFIDDLELSISAKDLLGIRDEIMERKLRTDMVTMPGLFEIINEFHSKLKLAIVTGAPQKFLDITLENLKIETYFDAFQTSDEIQNGKPNPEIYLKAIRKLKTLPQNCVVLEDSSNGARAGKNAGCYTIAIPSEYTQNQDFSFVDYIAKDLSEAKEHIQNLIISQ